MQVAEAYDFVCAGNRDGLRVYLASLDISGAFDTVPHQSLVESMMRENINPYFARFIERWLRKRKFSLRLGSQKGRLFSAKKPITRDYHKVESYRPSRGCSIL